MRTAFFHFSGTVSELQERNLLTTSIPVALNDALSAVNPSRPDAAVWQVYLPGTLLFDMAGLRLIENALRGVDPARQAVSIRLKVADYISRDYYSLHELDREVGAIPLNISAYRTTLGCTEDAVNRDSVSLVDLTIPLPDIAKKIDFPNGLCAPCVSGTPLALLLPYRNDFDLLFANQIAIVSGLASRVARSPLAWIKAGFSRRGGNFRQRCGLSYTSIHPTAQVHPSAVVEGAIIGARTRIGAHAVIRHSVVGDDVTIQDGAKVELSVVGNGTWLMHDLVLYRSFTEEGVFLIHGPYQFSAFLRGSAAFATIMMDYRADGKSISVVTEKGRMAYGGRFLGAVLREGAKCLGGTLLAPGRVVPAETWIGPDARQVHALKALLPKRVAVGPEYSKGHEEARIPLPRDGRENLVDS